MLPVMLRDLLSSSIATTLKNLQFVSAFHWSKMLAGGESLHSLTQLRRLAVNRNFFIPPASTSSDDTPLAHILPPSLQRLAVLRFNKGGSNTTHFMRRLKEYVDTKSRYMLEFKQIGTWDGNIGREHGLHGVRDFTELLAACRQAGVKFYGTLPGDDQNKLYDLSTTSI